MLIIKIFQTIAIEAFLRPYFSTFVQNHFISLLREVTMQVLHLTILDTLLHRWKCKLNGFVKFMKYLQKWNVVYKSDAWSQG